MAICLERPKVRAKRCIVTKHDGEAREGSSPGDGNVAV